MTNQKPREQWGTRIGVILAVAGSAVGLGNFLRFPGQVASNGGGAFMIPYFCAFLLLGLPLCWAEWSMGKYGGKRGYNSCPAIFSLLGGHSGWRYFGVLGLLIPLIIYMYYVLIESWCLGYAWLYLTGQINLEHDPSQSVALSKEFFKDFVGANEDGVMMQGSLHTSVIFWMIAFTVNFIVIYRGVTKGIERFCRIAMPLMLVCAALVLIRVLTLGTPDPNYPERNVINGLGFMWNPKGAEGGPWYSALGNPQVWLASAGQIFFTMSVGFSIITNYASYLRPKDDIVLTGLTAATTNEFCEVCLGGLITLPAAFIFLGATQISGSLNSSFALGFHTLPVVFLYMPLGRLIGFLWFFMLFLAAITSTLSMLQPVIAFLEEGLNIGRRAAVTLLGLISVLGSLFVIYFSKELIALDVMDFWIGNVALFVLAFIEVILFAWVFGAERGYKLAMEGAALRLPRFLIFVIKYISPVYLLIVLVMWSKENAPAYLDRFKEGVPRLTLYVMLGVFVFLTILVHIAGKRWRVAGVESPAEFGRADYPEGQP